MKLLLTSNGITTPSIAAALCELVGKPTAEANLVFIPTAADVESGHKDWLINDLYRLLQMGWRKMDVLDLVAMSSLPRDSWWPRIESADVIFVGGGNVAYLSYWMQKTGLFAELPRLLQTKVYGGISAGSQIVGESLHLTNGQNLVAGKMPAGAYAERGPAGQTSSAALQFVDFLFRPHFGSADFPNVRDHILKELAPQLDVPLYAMSDESALKIVDGTVTVVGEGAWKLYDPGA